MGKNLKISISVLLMIGLTSCSATKKDYAFQWQQNLTDVIPYKIGKARGVSVQSVQGRHILQGKDGFKLDPGRKRMRTQSI